MKSLLPLLPRRLALRPRPWLRGRLVIFFHSLRFRLLLWGAAILLLVLAIFSGIVYYRQAEYQKLMLGSAIQSEANYILETYRVAFYDAGGNAPGFSTVFPGMQAGSSKVSSQNGLEPSGKHVIPVDEVLLMIDLDGQEIGQAGRLSEQDVTNLKMLALKQLPIFKEIQTNIFYNLAISGAGNNPEPQEYLFVLTYAPLYPSTSQWAVVILGAPLDPGGELPRLRWTLVLASLIVLGFSLVGGYWLTGRLMRPVQAITRTAQEINANDLTRRLNLGKQDELGELADTFDRMLDRLENAFERQRQFTADASHELRTPLTITNLEVNRILEDPLTRPELQKSLGVIRDENERMTHLVNNLLVLARADAGRARLKTETVDFSELVLDVIERLIPLSQRLGVTISTGEMPPVVVRGDRFYLSQMVMNLVENAIKYGAGEERMVWIETGIREIGSDRWGWLRVEDHGPGIVEDHLPHLFDRFYRVDPERTHDESESEESSENSDGHGLGLSIAQWVARAHGGDVQVASQVGKGTVFEVVLPVAEPPEGNKEMT